MSRLSSGNYNASLMLPLLYYITDCNQFPGSRNEKEQRLLAKIGECAACGVDYIQLREKDLSVRALEALANQAVSALAGGSPTRLLINSRADVALACGAHGVHLPANDLAASEVRAIFARAGASSPVIGVSAHSMAEVSAAEMYGADFAVFAPVFEKAGEINPKGLEQLRQICHRPNITAASMPVLALGGITFANARQCLEAGARGIAAIRLVQQNDVYRVVKTLREGR
jgi:thiamine-phosphate pyrophosphorylase